MGYSQAEFDQATTMLVKALPGLDPRVARAWIAMEQGTYNNVLGVTSVSDHTIRAAVPGHPGVRQAGNGQYLYTYATMQEGINAAANLVKTSGNYGGIRTAIAGGNVRQQAMAVIASPWNHPYYSGAGSLLQQLTGANVPTSPAPAYSGPTLADALGRDATLTNPATILAIAKEVKAKGIGGSTLTLGDVSSYLTDFVGKKASQVPFNYSGVPGADTSKNVDKTAENSPIPGEGVDLTLGVGPAIQGLGETAVSVGTYLVAIILIGLGVFLYSKGGGGGEEVVSKSTSINLSLGRGGGGKNPPVVRTVPATVSGTTGKVVDE